MNVREQVQQQAQQRQQLARAGQNAGEGAHRGAIEPYALNSPRSMTTNSSHSLKRKTPSTFGPENVESWASTEVIHNYCCVSINLPIIDPKTIIKFS
jgi:hypothetical protein